MTVDEFYNKYNGQKIDVDGSYGNQCKDLFSLYDDEVVGNPDYVWGNAYELYANAPRSFYTPVDNPQKGDVVIWDKSYGGYGHVGIYWDGDINGTFRVFDQNSGGNLEACQLTTYKTRSKITGFLRPKTESEDIMDSTFRHEFLAETIRKARTIMLTGKLDTAGAEADIKRVETELDNGNKYALEQLFKDYEKASNYKCSGGDCDAILKPYKKGMTEIHNITSALI